MNLDERFTDFTDAITERMGSWRVSAMFVAGVLAWMILGPFMHYSDAWQLYINTPTTILEAFLAQWQLASSNRIEKHVIHLLEHIKDLVENRAVEDIHR